VVTQIFLNRWASSVKAMVWGKVPEPDLYYGAVLAAGSVNQRFLPQSFPPLPGRRVALDHQLGLFLQHEARRR